MHAPSIVFPSLFEVANQNFDPQLKPLAYCSRGYAGIEYDVADLKNGEDTDIDMKVDQPFQTIAHIEAAHFAEPRHNDGMEDDDSKRSMDEVLYEKYNQLIEATGIGNLPGMTDPWIFWKTIGSMTGIHTETFGEASVNSVVAVPQGIDWYNFFDIKPTEKQRCRRVAQLWVVFTSNNDRVTAAETIESVLAVKYGRNIAQRCLQKKHLLFTDLKLFDRIDSLDVWAGVTFENDTIVAPAGMSFADSYNDCMCLIQWVCRCCPFRHYIGAVHHFRNECYAIH